MAETEKKVPFNVVRTVSIITLVVGLFMFIWSLFNQHEVMCSVFGYRYKELPLYFVMVWSFLAGVVYFAIVWILVGIKSEMKTEALKKTIQQLNEKLNPP